MGNYIRILKLGFGLLCACHSRGNELCSALARHQRASSVPEVARDKPHGGKKRQVHESWTAPKKRFTKYGQERRPVTLPGGLRTERHCHKPRICPERPQAAIGADPFQGITPVILRPYRTLWVIDIPNRQCLIHEFQADAR